MKNTPTQTIKTSDSALEIAHIEELCARTIISKNQAERYIKQLQAQLAFPWYKYELINQTKLISSISKNKPLLKTLAKYYSVSNRTIKASRYFDSEALQTSNTNIKQLIVMLDQYTSDYFPNPNNSQDQLTCFKLLAPIQRLANLIGIKPQKLAKPFSQSWDGGLKALEESAGTKLNIDHIIEMMQASFQFAVLPILNEINSEIQTPTEQWYQHWFASYGLKRLMQMAEHWHQAYTEFSLARNQTTNIIHWESLLPSTKIGDYYITELNSHQALELEGEKLSHCVGSYTRNCLELNSLIYSIRDNNGTSLSTFEVLQTAGNFQIVQHHAYSNTRPENTQIKVANKFVSEHLNKISSEKINIINQQKQKLATENLCHLSYVNSNELRLSAAEKQEMASIISFTHPKKALKKNLKSYIKKNLNKLFYTNKMWAQDWLDYFCSNNGSFVRDSNEFTFACQVGNTTDFATFMRYKGDYLGTIFIDNNKMTYRITFKSVNTSKVRSQQELLKKFISELNSYL